MNQSSTSGRREEGTGRLPGHRSAGPIVLSLLLIASSGGATGAQESREVGDEEGAAGAAETGPDVHPDAVSRFVTRTYTAGPKELWDGLLTILEESGYPPEEVHRKERVVKTRFIDFESTDYSEEVGDPQPRVSDDYPILQMRRVKVGKVSLEARVSRGDRGTELAIRARILVQGLNRKENVLLLTDRRSSGVIEADFLRVLEDRLALNRL